ncbi:MAG: hypothetical protein AAFV38_08030, partial [Pseudomonadota bacterium]
TELMASAPDAVLHVHATATDPTHSLLRLYRILGLAVLFCAVPAFMGLTAFAARYVITCHPNGLRTFRLLGAFDRTIVRIVMQPLMLSITAAATIGATVATAPFLVVAWPMPVFQGLSWIGPVLIPPLAGLVAFATTRSVAYRHLKDLP